MSLHKNITYVDGHIIHALEYANAGARTGASGLVSGDVGKVAKQTDTPSWWLLVDTIPTWREIAPTPGGGSAKAVITWGNNSISTTTTTRYLTPAYEDGAAPTTVIQWRVPFNGTLKNLRVRQNTGAGNGNNIVYTVRKNSSAQALAATLASTANDGNDLTNTVTVTAGDLVDIEVTKAASIGTSPSDIVASLEYDAT